VAENRRVWRARQPALDPTRLVFIDETGANTKMARLRGRCRRGQRLVAAVPHGHWKTMTFIAGLRHDGITAPFVVDRPMNGTIFRLWVERCLVPTLAQGDIVVMDNLSSHKIAGVREAIEAVGAKLAYLPAYSPDFNPIEQFFAKLKAMLRKAAVRTIDELWRAIGHIINTVTPNECVNYFANSGYEPN
jgi:transposase